MPDRLTALDTSFLYLERDDVTMHAGSVMCFDLPEDGLDVEALFGHLRARIAYVPRYRQRLRRVPGRLANPVWVDDEDFDLNYHVQRVALPAPGSDEELSDLVARIVPRPLDRRRPLWELYLVEGFRDNRFAVISKTHLAMVDGVRTVDLAQVVLDDTAHTQPAPRDTWRPAPEPTTIELITSAIVHNLRAPSKTLESTRSFIGGLGQVRPARAAAGLAGLLHAARPAPDSPLNGPTGHRRRFAMVNTDLADYRRIRDHHALLHRKRQSDEVARFTINDVVLATLAGALRNWLLGRGWQVDSSTFVRALLPVSVALTPDDESYVGSRVDTQLVDLPVGEPNASVRLQRVAYQMMGHASSGRAVAASRIASVPGFGPPTIHALGTRVAQGLSSRLFNLVVTNVPGPQQPLYAGKARMRAAYPVIPVLSNQSLSVGVTSYDGRVFMGLTADGEALYDLDVLVSCLQDSLAELLETVR